MGDENYCFFLNKNLLLMSESGDNVIHYQFSKALKKDEDSRVSFQLFFKNHSENMELVK